MLSLKKIISSCVLPILLTQTVFLAGPLHDAVRNGDIEEVKRLLNDSADVNEKDKKGRTPLMSAYYTSNSLKIIKTFLAFGANTHKTDKKLRTPEQLLDAFLGRAHLLHTPFDQHYPVGTLKAHAARACCRYHLPMPNELVPQDCKEYVLTHKWMDDFFEKGMDSDETTCTELQATKKQKMC